jgi:hypothetical protein
MVFQSASQQVAQVASETSIASNMAHPNIVTTYSHMLRCIDSPKESMPPCYGAELQLFKLYLIQV